MRSVVAGLALLVGGCLGDIEGVGDEPDTRSGSGSAEEEEPPQPRVAATFDKPTLTTQLARTEMLALSVTSEHDFSGAVTLAATLVASAGAVPTEVVLTGPMTPTLTLAPGATQTATFQLEIPMTALGTAFTGNLKVDLTSAAGATSVSSAVTIEPIYTVDYLAGTGYTTDKHANTGTQNLAVKRGAILRFKNSDVIEHVIKADGAFSAYHENTVSGGAPGRAYDIPTSAIPEGSTGTLGCFNHTGTSATYSVL